MRTVIRVMLDIMLAVTVNGIRKINVCFVKLIPGRASGGPQFLSSPGPPSVLIRPCLFLTFLHITFGQLRIISLFLFLYPASVFIPV